MMPSLDADAMGSTSDYMDNGSVLDDLGAEVTGIAFPVSVCMAITVALVRLLNGGDDGKGRVIIGEAVYGEKVLMRSRLFHTFACEGHCAN
jgi:hypothetical protein